jgi:transcriptional regulator with XRE-family HTH domain
VGRYSAKVRRLPPTRLQELRGRALRYFREEHHLTQAQVARLAKVSVTTIGRLETRGPRHPRHYLRVCRVLMVSPQEIDQWLAAREIDPRLWPLVFWFLSQTPSTQDVIGELLRHLE